MRIAICDDELQETLHLEQLIKTYAFQHDYDLQCERFTDGRDLLQREKFDLYFLDFYMEPMDGIAVAQALKEKFSHAVTVCYLTSYEGAAMQIINHRIYADGFLKKPVEPKLLYDKLEQFYRASFSGRLELKKGKGYQTVYTQDVLYIEADGKRSTFHFADHTESYNYLLTKLESEVLHNVCFYRIHRSFIVNLQYVLRYDSKTVTLTDGTVLPLKTRNFRDVYRDYLFQSNS